MNQTEVLSPYYPLTQIRADVLSQSLVFMLVCVALAASNQPKGIPVIMNYYLNQLDTLQQKIHWIEYTRNGIMKSAVLCGAPRVINAEVELYANLPTEYKSLLRTTPLNKQSSTIWDTRGYPFFEKIYGVNTNKTETTINDANCDLWNYVKERYGDLISDMTYLSPVETELEVVVSLIQMDTMTQLNDHRQGALNVGATLKQLKEAEAIGFLVKNMTA